MEDYKRMRRLVAMFFIHIAELLDKSSTVCGDIRGAVCNLETNHKGKHTDGNLYWDESGAYFKDEEDDF